MNFQNPISLFNSFFQFQRNPSPLQCALIVGVLAAVVASGLLGDAGAAEREGEFSILTMGEDGMVELSRRQDAALDESLDACAFGKR